MPIVRYFQPRYADVGAYARAGAAGVAARENLSQSLGRQQQYDLSQQHIDLQREGMYQTLAARLADSRMQAAQNAAELAARQKENEASRTHATQMQQAGFEQAKTMAESNSERQLNNQTALAELDAKQRQVQYDYELTARDEAMNKQINESLSQLRQQHAAGEISDDELADWTSSLTARRLGLQKSPIPRRKSTTLRHELFGDDPDGQNTANFLDVGEGVMFRQPDGKVEYRPKKTDKPAVMFSDVSRAYTDIRSALTKVEADPVTKKDREIPPKESEIEAELAKIVGIHQRLAGIQPQASVAPPIAPAPSTLPTPAAPAAQQAAPATSPSAPSPASAPVSPREEDPGQAMLGEVSQVADRYSHLLPDLKQGLSTVQSNVASHGWNAEKWPKNEAVDSLWNLYEYDRTREAAPLPAKIEPKTMERGMVYGPVKAPDGKHYDVMWNGTKLVAIGEYKEKK